MTAYITLVIITAFLSILLTFKITGRPTLNWFITWLAGVGLGIAILTYITLPLMAWSTILTVLFWIATLFQLFVVTGALVAPNLTKHLTLKETL